MYAASTQTQNKNMKTKRAKSGDDRVRGFVCRVAFTTYPPRLSERLDESNDLSLYDIFYSYNCPI